MLPLARCERPLSLANCVVGCVLPAPRCYACRMFSAALCHRAALTPSNHPLRPDTCAWPQKFDVLDPTTGEAVFQVAEADAPDVDR